MRRDRCVVIAAGHCRPAHVIRLGDPRAKTLPIRYAPPQVAAALLPPRVQTRPTIPIAIVRLAVAS